VSRTKLQQPAASLGTGRYWVAASVCMAVFLVSYLILRDESIQMPHQGLQSVKAASSLIEGRGFEVSPSVPFAKFGPLLPALLALLSWSGMAVIPATYLIGCATFSATLFGIYALGRAAGIRSPWAAPTFYALLASNYYLLRTALADGIVIAASLFAMLGAIYLARRCSHLVLLGTALACAVASTARYMAAFTLLPVVFLAMLLFREVGWRRRLIDLSVFGVVAAGPIGAWMIRNYLLTGFVTGISRSGYRIQAADTSLFPNILGLLKTILLDLYSYETLGLRQFLYWEGGASFPVAVMATGLGAAALLLLVFWCRRRELKVFIKREVRERTCSGIAIVLIGSYAGVYLVTLVLLWTIGNNDPIHTRFVAPIYPYFVLLGFVAFAAISRHGIPGWPGVALLTVALLIVIPNAGKSLRLFGAFPGEKLIELRSYAGLYLWDSEVSWRGEVKPHLLSGDDGMSNDLRR
jgi:hypothetical protein